MIHRKGFGMRHIAVLGSTGSIGTQTLDVIRHDTEIKVDVLAAYGNVELIKKQALEFKPHTVCLYDRDRAKELKDQFDREGFECTILSGEEGLKEAASMEGTELVVVAVVGMIGIAPTIAAINAGKDIALANKETLVCAGHIIMPLVKEKAVRLLPVDSEHSAIFQCLAGESHESVSKLILTASGGPFRGYTREMLKSVSLEDALKHPNWSMGKKITVDSATMVNKGLEVMEAHWLFDIDYKDIEVLVQPESIIHSMVLFRDGAVKAQLGVPDMRVPIEYALYAPERVSIDENTMPDFERLSSITLQKPDMEVFEGLKLGIEAGIKGGSMPTVYNAANEEAVKLFLEGKIRFTDITESVKAAMDAHRYIASPGLEEISKIESDARKFVKGRFDID